MQFTPEETQELLHRFPYLELSYDPILHRKVNADIFVLIPKGIKSFLWFTYWRHDNIAISIPLDSHGGMDLPNIKAHPCCFSTEVALGTVLYGTLVSMKNGFNIPPLFSCESIYYYQGFHVGQQLFVQKLEILLNLFTYHLRQTALTHHTLVIGLPVMKRSYQEAEHAMALAPYSVTSITLFSLQNIHPHGTYIQQHAPAASTPVASAPAASTPVSAPAIAPAKAKYLFSEEPADAAAAVSANFIVQALPGMDSYMLHCQNGEYGVAMVPSYKCSVLLNQLFRTIKENGNLDLLEESDEESEFEDIRENKFVNLEKLLPMTCVFSKRFKKWIPAHLVNDQQRLITLKEAQYLERKR